jgi:3-hydroxyacyl-CoA dehydrogenase
VFLKAFPLDQIAKDASVKAVVLIGGGRTFVVGADIKEFDKMTSGTGKPRGAGLLPLLLKIEDSSKPVIVAIHGTTFGGGLELAMAGHYRVHAPRAQLGQPEVKLGLIPGRGRDAALTAARWCRKSRGDVCQWESN